MDSLLFVLSFFNKKLARDEDELIEVLNNVISSSPGRRHVVVCSETS